MILNKPLVLILNIVNVFCEVKDNYAPTDFPCCQYDVKPARGLVWIGMVSSKMAMF